MQDKKKTLERIKKLLRMAADVGSPNEAAIAARRAERLMAEHNLSNMDVATAELEFADFLEEGVGDVSRKIPQHSGVLAVAVARFTDCQARIRTISTSPRMDQVMFQGEASDLEVCKYLYTYLSRTLKYLAENSGAFGRRGYNNFKYAATLEIAHRLAEMKKQDQDRDNAKSNGKAMVLLNKKLVKLQDHFGNPNYGKARGGITDFAAFEWGREAGKNVAIHKGVSGKNGQGLLEG